MHIKTVSRGIRHCFKCSMTDGRAYRRTGLQTDGQRQNNFFLLFIAPCFLILGLLSHKLGISETDDYFDIVQDKKHYLVIIRSLNMYR